PSFVTLPPPVMAGERLVSEEGEKSMLPLSLTAPVSPAVLPVNSSVPLLTLVGPPYVSLPPRTSVPAPFIVTPPPSDPPFPKSSVMSSLTVCVVLDGGANRSVEAAREVPCRKIPEPSAEPSPPPVGEQNGPPGTAPAPAVTEALLSPDAPVTDSDPPEATNTAPPAPSPPPPSPT